MAQECLKKEISNTSLHIYLSGCVEILLREKIRETNQQNWLVYSLLRILQTSPHQSRFPGR